MRKTDIVDVYILNAVEPVIKGTTTHLKRRKICIAFIPDVTRSSWCKEIMDNSPKGELLVNCKYYSEKYKWEPILISTSKRPSFIEDFDVKQIE